MDNEYDIYITNIYRARDNHYEISKELEFAINCLVEEKNLVTELGIVSEIKIPKIQNENLNDNIKTCYGFVRMTIPDKHDKTAKLLDKQMFYGFSIRAMVNSVPCYFSSLKFQPNIHVQKINIFNSANNGNNSEINRLNQELNDSKFQNQINISEIGRLNQEVTNLRIERDNNSDEVAELRKKNDELEREVNLVNTRYNKLKEVALQLGQEDDNKIIDLNKEIVKLRVELANVKWGESVGEILKEKNTKKKISFTSTREDLRGQLEEKRIENEKLKKQLEEAVIQMEKLKINGDFLSIEREEKAVAIGNINSGRNMQKLGYRPKTNRAQQYQN
ncbi:unnamed protein product [Brachionus calyciflorus]|uniref:Uncharacterized protein n=1 Tax=Brachionus calyciflorus TaxID=104777 RepID=A0A814S3V2_9BILA|nr:unnamed protein product [Brachionus calyciflorus]